MLVAEHGGDTTLPWIGIMRALYPGEAAPPLSKADKQVCQVIRPSSPRGYFGAV
jgi:hypothetical protein